MNNYTIGIKLGDGSFYPILEEGFTGKKRFILTTIRDNQDSMQIDIFRSQNNDIESADYIGSLMIEEIAPALKGEPEIEVVLGLDEENKLNAVAKNLASEDKQTLSVVLESLNDDDRFGMPDFELGEDIKTTKSMDKDTDTTDESITGDTYPFEEEDRRKKHIKKKRNPFFAFLFVILGLIGIAGLSILVYWVLSIFNVVEFNINKIPLSIFKTEQTIEENNKNNVNSEDKNSDTGPVDKEKDTQDKNQVKNTDQADQKDESGTGQGDEEDGATEDSSEKKTEILDKGFYYLIKRGDTLWDIAGTYYKDPFQWYRIYREPKNNIKDPDLIFADSKLYIPKPED